MLGGRYSLEKLVYDGQMGRVFAAKQLSMDRRVAVKVLPRKDERLGEVPIAVVLCKSGCKTQDLEAHCASKLAAFKVPEEFIMADAPLPRLGTGKIDRVTLQKQYGG